MTIRITSVNAMGDRASSSVGPVYGLPRPARPHAIKGSLAPRPAAEDSSLVDAFPGTAAVFVQDLRTGRGAAWNARARFMGASTLKLGIAIEVLRVLGGKPPADSQIGDLFRRMLVYSDNAAANDLEVWLGGGDIYTGSARVTATLRALGLYDSYINGGYILGTADRKPIPLNVVEQPSYYSTGKYTSAWDLARIHKFLHRGAGGHGPLLGLLRSVHRERRALHALDARARARPGEARPVRGRRAGRLRAAQGRLDQRRPPRQRARLLEWRRPRRGRHDLPGRRGRSVVGHPRRKNRRDRAAITSRARTARLDWANSVVCSCSKA